LATGPDAPPMPKSKVIAVLLALYFGPLGLLYLVVKGRMIILLLIGLGILFFPLLFVWAHMSGIGWLIALVARVACVSFVLGYMNRPAGAQDVAGQAEILLDEAVKLENIDFGQAIAKYEEVITKFPNSRASKAANSCLKTIRQIK